MNIIYIVCIVSCLVVMIVSQAYSGDVRVAGGIMEQERSECLNITSDKNQPEFRTPSSEFRIPNPGTLNLQPETLNFLLRQAVKTWVTIYTSGSDMITFRDTFNTWGLIMAPQKTQ